MTVGTPSYAQEKPGAFTLKGGVDHSDFLPPVPDELKAGATPKEDTPDVDNDWYRIPNWLAGTWPRQAIQRYYFFDYHTKKESTGSVSQMELSTSDYGYLPDSKGDVWDTSSRAATVRSDFGPTFGISRITSNKVISAGDNHVIMESKGTLTVVDKKKNKIVSTHQCEAIRIITLVQDGSIAVDSSQKDFDEDGHPLSLAKSKYVSNKTAPFDPSRGTSDKRMVRQFGQFLQQHYWNDLIPGCYYALE